MPESIVVDFMIFLEISSRRPISSNAQAYLSLRTCLHMKMLNFKRETVVPMAYLNTVHLFDALYSVYFTFVGDNVKIMDQRTVGIFLIIVACVALGSCARSVSSKSKLSVKELKFAYEIIYFIYVRICLIWIGSFRIYLAVLMKTQTRQTLKIIQRTVRISRLLIL